MRVKISALAIILISGVYSACGTAKSSEVGSKEDKSPVIAEIDGNATHMSAFDRFVKSRLADFNEQSEQSQEEKDRQRSQMLDEFIQRQVIIQEARKKKIEPTDEEIRATLEEQHRATLEEQRKQETNQTHEALDSNERRVEIYNDLCMRKFHTESLQHKEVSVNRQEVEDYYKQNADRYQGKGGFLVREIRVSQEEQAQRLYRLALAKPADFPVLAKENSESPTAINGGLMDYEAHRIPPVLEQAIAPLKVGSISKVVKSSYGYHIFKLEQRSQTVSLEKAKSEIEDKLLSEKNQRLIDELDDRLVAKARIKIYRNNLGFNYVGTH